MNIHNMSGCTIQFRQCTKKGSEKEIPSEALAFEQIVLV